MQETIQKRVGLPSGFLLDIYLYKKISPRTEKYIYTSKLRTQLATDSTNSTRNKSTDAADITRILDLVIIFRKSPFLLKIERFARLADEKNTDRRFIREELDGRFRKNLGYRNTVPRPECKNSSTLRVYTRDSICYDLDTSPLRASEVRRSRNEEYFESV